MSQYVIEISGGDGRDSRVGGGGNGVGSRNMNGGCLMYGCMNERERTLGFWIDFYDGTESGPPY
jgi:hypothetical protein